MSREEDKEDIPCNMEIYGLVKNPYNRTVFYGFSVMLTVMGTLSQEFPVVYILCLLAFILFTFLSPSVKVLAPLGNWFSYCYLVAHVLIFICLYFCIFLGFKSFIFLLIVLMFIYNFMVSFRWQELQYKCGVGDDDLLKK